MRIKVLLLFCLLILVMPIVNAATNPNSLLLCTNDPQINGDFQCTCNLASSTNFETTYTGDISIRYFQTPGGYDTAKTEWWYDGKKVYSGSLTLSGDSYHCWGSVKTISQLASYTGTGSAVGSWQVKFYLNGQLKGTKSFEITDSSAQTCVQTGCSAGYYCDTSSGECKVETCVQTGCQTGYTCNTYTGQCEYSDPCEGVSCDYWEYCDSSTGTCENKCGNKVLDSDTEDCDKSSYGKIITSSSQDTTCETLGYSGGTLYCYNCQLNENDCTSDTDTTCTAGETLWCDTGEQGVCQHGTKTCTDGEWGECVQDTQAQSSEQNCDDAYDDDCDGFTDAYDSDCGGTTPITTISGNLIYQSGTKKLKYTDTTSASSFSTYDMYVKIICDSSPSQGYSSSSYIISSQSDSKYFYVSTLLSSISSETTCTAYAYSGSSHITQSTSFTYTPTTQVAECGNDYKEGDEQCDGYDLPYTNCATYDSDIYSSGTLSCDTDCTYNLDNCDSLPIDTDTETDDDFEVDIIDNIDDIIDDSESESDAEEDTTDDISEDLIEFYDENPESKTCTFNGNTLSTETECTENDLLFCYSSLYDSYDAQNTCKCAEVKKMNDMYTLFSDEDFYLRLFDTTGNNEFDIKEIKFEGETVFSMKDNNFGYNHKDISDNSCFMQNIKIDSGNDDFLDLTQLCSDKQNCPLGNWEITAKNGHDFTKKFQVIDSLANYDPSNNDWMCFFSDIEEKYNPGCQQNQLLTCKNEPTGQNHCECQEETEFSGSDTINFRYFHDRTNDFTPTHIYFSYRPFDENEFGETTNYNFPTENIYGVDNGYCYTQKFSSSNNYAFPESVTDLCSYFSAYNYPEYIDSCPNGVWKVEYRNGPSDILETTEFEYRNSGSTAGDIINFDFPDTVYKKIYYDKSTLQVPKSPDDFTINDIKQADVYTDDNGELVLLVFTSSTDNNDFTLPDTTKVTLNQDDTVKVYKSNNVWIVEGQYSDITLPTISVDLEIGEFDIEEVFNGSSIIINEYGTACVVLDEQSRYQLNLGNDEPFALYLPKGSDDFTVCIKKDLLFCYSSLYDSHDAQDTCKCAEVKKKELLT